MTTFELGANSNAGSMSAQLSIFWLIHVLIMVFKSRLRRSATPFAWGWWAEVIRSLTPTCLHISDQNADTNFGSRSELIETGMPNKGNIWVI